MSTKTDGDGIGNFKCCDDAECAGPVDCVTSIEYSLSCSDGCNKVGSRFCHSVGNVTVVLFHVAYQYIYDI